MKVVEHDVAARRQVRGLAALLDHETPPWREGELPPLAHWLLFPPDARQSALGLDGHPARDDTGLPRRMWAGSRVRFLAPVPLDAEVTRETTELSSADKEGRSGRMRFVTLLRRIHVGGALAIEEEQDIVYRAAVAPGASATPPPPVEQAAVPTIARRVQLDPVALFRYSALTFNGHRIHYDRDHAMRVEGYPGLVVHGPLIATLLMDQFLRHRPGAAVTRFAFRATRPIFDGDPFTLGLVETAGGVALSAIDHLGGLAMAAEVAAE